MSEESIEDAQFHHLSMLQDYCCSCDDDPCTCDNMFNAFDALPDVCDPSPPPKERQELEWPPMPMHEPMVQIAHPLRITYTNTPEGVFIVVE